MEEKSLSLKRAEWSERAEFLLSRSNHDRLVGMKTLRAIVDAGADLFTLDLGGEVVAAWVVAVNECEGGNEAVIVAAGADLPGASLTAAMAESVRLTHGYCDRIRVSASRPGMERRLKALGFNRMAATYTMDL